MAVDPRTPVIIGVGQFLDREADPARPMEPTDLMAEALRAAEHDAGAPGALADADVVAVVPTVSWRYRDPGALVAASMGATDARTWYPAMGGNTPQMLVNRLAVRHRGRSGRPGRWWCGGEAYRRRVAAKRAGTQLPWTRQADDVEATWHEGDSFVLGHPAEMARGIFLPTQSYPLFESALWHASGRTLDEHLAAVGEMWAGFSRVAADNPYAWRRDAYTADEITTPTPDNRMVGFPYTKRMVSNPDVDMAAGCIVCSVERAEVAGRAPRPLGVPARRHRRPGPRHVASGPTFTSSPAIGVAGNRALELAGVGIDDVAHLDVYSCFPSAVQLALRELGIDPGRQLTVYGGLCFAGGPWNNPVGHAIASMVGVLRDDPGSLGLVTANGGNVDEARLRRVLHRATGRRVPLGAPPGRDRRRGRPRGVGDLRGPGHGGGLDRDARAGRVHVPRPRCLPDPGRGAGLGRDRRRRHHGAVRVRRHGRRPGATIGPEGALDVLTAPIRLSPAPGGTAAGS